MKSKSLAAPLLFSAIVAAYFPAVPAALAAPLKTTAQPTVSPKAAIKTAPVSLERIIPEGGDAAPARTKVIAVDYDGKQLPAVEISFLHRERASHVIFFPIEGLDPACNTLTFKARLNAPAQQLNDFEITLIDKKGGNSGTRILEHATKLDNGWYSFKWDVVNQQDVGGGLDLGAVARIQLGYPFAKVPADAPIVLTMTDVQFVSGSAVRTGDPELYQQWKNYISAYAPDYGDSSRYLQPPAAGRIATPIGLTRSGKALGKIVLPQGAPAPLTLAGQELTHWLKAITGAEFAVGAPAAAPPAGEVRLLLGRSFAAGKFDKDLAWLGQTDGFAVRARGNDVFIFGATDRGTLNGVFAFLENNTDIIWPRPQPELSAVFSTQPNLKAVWADARERPATLLRGWGTNMGLRPETEIWSLRNRNNYPLGGGTEKPDGLARIAQGNFIEFGGGHNLNGFIANQKEFFPVIDGKQPEVLDIWKHQINFTAPGVVDTVAANVLKYIEKHAPPGIDCVNIKIEDNWGVSTDPKSLEPIRLPDGTLLPSTDRAFRSTQFFLFLNEVTKKVNKVHPNLMIGTYAYFFTAPAPKVPVDPHIRVYFCPYVRRDQRTPLSSPVNTKWWEQLVEWARISPNVVMREYYGLENGGRPLAEVVSFDVRSYVARGVRQYTAELMPDEEMIWGDGVRRGGRNEWDMMAMEYWIINRIYWDPTQDVEQLRKYYLRRTFREAAPVMEKFFGTLRTAWYQEATPSSFEYPDAVMIRHVLNTGTEAAMRQHLTDASAAVAHPVARLSVDVTRERFDQWTAWAKDRARKNADKAITADTALRYGWQHLEFGRASATVINREGKTIPATRVTVRFDSKTPRHRVGLINVFLNGRAEMKAGDTLHFTLTPASTGETLKPLRLIMAARDKAGARIEAPADAFEAAPSGGLKVRWKLQSAPGAAPAFDATRITELILIWPDDLFGPAADATFYLTDLSWEHAAP